MWFSDMDDNKLRPVYLYEVDDLLGGDALSPYDLAALASNDIRWLSVNKKDKKDEPLAAQMFT